MSIQYYYYSFYFRSNCIAKCVVNWTIDLIIQYICKNDDEKGLKQCHENCSMEIFTEIAKCGGGRESHPQSLFEIHKKSILEIECEKGTSSGSMNEKCVFAFKMVA